MDETDIGQVFRNVRHVSGIFRNVRHVFGMCCHVRDRHVLDMDNVGPLDVFVLLRCLRGVLGNLFII